MIDVVLVCDQGYFGGSVVSGSTFKCVCARAINNIWVCGRYQPPEVSLTRNPRSYQLFEETQLAI